jgi:hypothetical protein
LGVKRIKSQIAHLVGKVIKNGSSRRNTSVMFVVAFIGKSFPRPQIHHPENNSRELKSG